MSSLETERLTETKQQLVLTVAEHIALSLANLKLRHTARFDKVAGGTRKMLHTALNTQPPEVKRVFCSQTGLSRSDLRAGFSRVREQIKLTGFHEHLRGRYLENATKPSEIFTSVEFGDRLFSLPRTKVRFF